MKKIFTILGFFFTIATFAQTGDDVVSALKNNSTSKFTSYFSSNVNVKLPQKDEMKNVNKSDAASIVSGFFTSNNINGFEVISQREINGTMYIAGKLKGSSNDYGLTVMLETKGNNMSIITVRIS